MISKQKNDYIYHEQHMLRFPQLPNQKSSPVVLSLVAPLVPIHNHAPRLWIPKTQMAGDLDPPCY